MELVLNKKLDFIKRVFKNKYWTLGVILALAMFVYFWMFPTVFADYTNVQGVKDNFENFIKGAQKSSIEYMSDAYKSFSEIFDPKNTKFTFEGVVRGIITTLAGGAICIYFAIGIVKEGQKGDLSMEYWQRIILNFTISLIVTILVGKIMSSIYELGSIVINGFIDGTKQAALSISDDQKKTLSELLSKIPGLESLNDTVYGTSTVDYEKLKKANEMLVYMEYIVWFPMVICVFLMYSAIFEIKVREGRSSQLLGGAWERVKSMDRCLGGVGGGGGTGVGRLGRVV